MRRIARLAMLAALIAPVAAGAQNIVIDDFGSGTTSFPATSTVPLRRGVTTNVQIIKDLIDLVPFNLVSISGGGTISSISNGRTSSGKGFIRMNIAVPSGQSTGSTITLKVGLSDQFRFSAVHRGLISSVVSTPQPATIVPGTPFIVAVQGTDLGNVSVRAIPCHSIVASNRTNSSVRFTLTHAGTCPNTSYAFALVPGTGTAEAPSYPLASGVASGFAFAYQPPPPVGLACSSAPGIGQTRITAPTAGQTLFFRSGTSSPTNILVRWDSLTNSQVAAPLNEWIVTRRVQSTRGTSVPSLAGFIDVQTEVRGLSVSLPFSVPGTQSVSVRAKNCGVAAPAATLSFTTAFQ
jgi:hypothetical protein